MEPFEQFYYDWDTFNNHEPFWGALHDTDLSAIAADVGFPADGVVQHMAPNVLATDLLQDKITHGEDFKRTAGWLAFCAEK